MSTTTPRWDEGAGAALRAATEADTAAAGYELGLRVRAGDVVVLTGPLGCGKTVFVRGLARALGIAEPVTSPSFLIVQQYEGSPRLCHMDLYRVRTLDEVEGLGFRDMLAEGAVIAIEWGERAAPLLPGRRWEVGFRIEPDGSRRILVEERS